MYCAYYHAITRICDEDDYPSASTSAAHLLLYTNAATTAAAATATTTTTTSPTTTKPMTTAKLVPSIIHRDALRALCLLFRLSLQEGMAGYLLTRCETSCTNRDHNELLQPSRVDIVIQTSWPIQGDDRNQRHARIRDIMLLLLMMMVKMMMMDRTYCLLLRVLSRSEANNNSMANSVFHSIRAVRTCSWGTSATMIEKCQHIESR